MFVAYPEKLGVVVYFKYNVHFCKRHVQNSYICNALENQMWPLLWKRTKKNEEFDIHESQHLLLQKKVWLNWEICLFSETQI